MPSRPNRPQPQSGTFEVPNIFFDNLMRELNLGEMRVYLYLCSRTNFEPTHPYQGPTLFDVHEACNLDIESAEEALKTLFEKGLADYLETPQYRALDPTPRGSGNAS